MDIFKIFSDYLTASNLFGLIGTLGLLYTLCDHYKKHGSHLGFIKEQSLPLIIDKTLEKDLVILYKGKRIKQVEEVRYRIFNYGDQTLRREELYNNKFKIFVRDGEIFDIKLKVKNGKEKCTVKRISNKLYELDFDYFNIDQLIELSILSSTENVLLECSAAGMFKIKEFSKPMVSLKDFLLTTPGLFLFCVACYSLIQKQSKGWMDWSMLVICSISLTNACSFSAISL